MCRTAGSCSTADSDLLPRVEAYTDPELGDLVHNRTSTLRAEDKLDER